MTEQMGEAAPRAGTAFGDLLRSWRERRRFTQMDLAMTADVSTRHLSFLETGRANPSREMALVLAEHLEVPLRERNELLHAAGFTPVYPRRSLDAPEMAPVSDAIETILHAHEPYPAVAVDRYWDVVEMNSAAVLFADGVDPDLLGPPINVYRLSLHPSGLAPRIANFPVFAHHLLRQLRHDVAVSADPDLGALLEEVTAYPDVRQLARRAEVPGTVVIPMRLRHPTGELALFTTIATFGTPVDVTVAELALETFFPADAATAHRLTDLAAARAPGGAT
jgi:transcriptional regulator with XRE-family HTH domain